MVVAPLPDWVRRPDLDEMLRSVLRFPAGDYAEVGVWRGECAARIAKGMNNDFSLWLFDSFLGHAEPGEHDIQQYHWKGRYSDTSPELISGLVPSAKIVKGWIPDSLEIVTDRKFRFVRVDVDHYAPTYGATKFFLPRMVKGGIIQFDDYKHDHCPGATKAIEELIGPNQGYWVM